MILRTTNNNEIIQIFEKLDNYIKKDFSEPNVKFLDLGTHKIRLLIYNEEFIPHIEKQMTFVLRDNLESYDATLVLWKEQNIKNLPAVLTDNFNLKINLKLRLELLIKKYSPRFARIFDENNSATKPIFLANFKKNIIEAENLATNTYYYGVNDLSPEEFIKEGHLFVQFVNKIIKSENTNIVHGAVVGIDNNGVLFCARGQRGKSTLTVLSMLEGFEYVSDDYLILEKEGNNLYSYPIYSIITLSQKMYNELYNKLGGTKFVSNNARKDKYVFNIANLHNQFKIKYPIKTCIFPEIVNQEKPSINVCSREEKSRAIVQLIQSTVSQMRDANNEETIKRLYDMIKDFKFYKLNLCPDILANTEFLREFLKNFKEEIPEEINEDNFFVDITFDIANFLDAKNGTLYQMNHFATAIYQSLLEGRTKEDILNILKDINELDENFKADLDILIKEIKDKNLIRDLSSQIIKPNYDIDLLKKNKFKLSFKKFEQERTIELINKENKDDELCIK